MFSKIIAQVSKRIVYQLLFGFLLTALPLQSFLIYTAYETSKGIIQKETFNNLSGIAERQATAIEDFFENTLTSIEGLVDAPVVLKALANPEEAEEKESRTRRALEKHLEDFQLEDLLLVNPQGLVVFSLKNPDLKGRSLRSPDYLGSALAGVFERAAVLLQADFSDFSQNPRDRGSLYMGAPVRNEAQRFEGVMVVKLSKKALEEVIGDYTGLGQTGESVLFYQEKERAVFAADTRLSKGTKFEKSIELKQHPQVLQSLKGQSGEGIMTDYRGSEVFAKYRYVPALRSALTVKIDTEEALAPIKSLRNRLLLLMLAAILLFMFTSVLLAGAFSKPLYTLTQTVQKAAEGDLNQTVLLGSKNEIGQLAEAFNTMLRQLRASKEALQDYARNLEQKVDERTQELQTTNEELQTANEEINQSNEELTSVLSFVSEQKEAIEKINEDITAGLTYAKRIQEAHFPLAEDIKFLVTDYFVLWKPRNIVSGDFYWFHRIDEYTGIFAAADCTGHGVPGALMSILGNSILNGIVIQNNVTEPDLILNKLHRGIRNSLKQQENEGRDGMDIAIIKVDLKHKILEYAGAKNPLFLIQGQEIHHIKGDSNPIGGFQRERQRIFTKHRLELKEENLIYLYSDGFQDQFGGERGKKLMSSNFRKLLTEIAAEPFSEQKQLLEQAFNQWKYTQEQLDDVLVAGLKIVC